MFEIAVVGSLNLDTTVKVRRLPAPGETVLGRDHFTDSGGKGANQAVAAARLGRTVAMIGAVGDDGAGPMLAAALAAAGVDTSAIRTITGTASGMAVITVADSGENSIVVDPGANGWLEPVHVRAAVAVLAEASVTLAQLEVPLAAVAEAARLTRGRFVLNPAPAAPVPPELLALTDVLVPNATELGVLLSEEPPAGPDDAARMARRLRGPAAVVVTLGAQGAVVVTAGTVAHVAAPAITPVDPTAAGDAFCGGLADALVAGADLVAAAHWAVRCGAAAATRWGAQSSLPTRSDVAALDEA
ncbi:MAG: hypothetical protein A2Z12_05800 [Actinobacteria bacterium RBG_16_68_21]|nr:MAG: hypothetical protein A2Z12_05800 [Actinobacteria bacterium RBG_16_68_21]